ncbi:MAG TPA: recombinase RecA [bacterium]|nr:recombinase RecA [bacterium]
MIDPNKQKAVELAMAQIEKNFGKGSIMKLGDREQLQVAAIPTGSIALDLALGVGGVPRGRITEIYGPESSGKTTLCSHIIAEAQKQNGTVAFVDAEHAFDPVYAKNIGVDVDNLLISQPDTGEQALEIVETLIRSGALDVVVVDSVAALTPRAEIEGEMGDSHMGLHARLMSQALRKLAGIVNKTNTALIFTNQIRMKIGVMFGNPETTTGGQALKFYSSIRIDVRRLDQIKRGEEIVGNRVRARVVKNKVAPPFRTAEFEIMYNEGISHAASLVDVGVETKVIDKSGSWYSYAGEKIGQGKEAVKDFLKANPQTAQKIESQIRSQVATLSPTTVAGESEEEIETRKENEAAAAAPSPAPRPAISKDKKSDGINEDIF